MDIANVPTKEDTRVWPTPEHIEAMKAIIKQENMVIMIERDHKKQRFLAWQKRQPKKPSRR